MVRTGGRKEIRRQGAGRIPRIPDLRANERIFADLHAALKEQDFSSIEQAEEFALAMLAAGGPPRAVSTTPLERAQEIMYDAWDATGEERIRLALTALTLSKDCADAYVLLAEDVADEAGLATRLLEDGMHAGERALGERIFREEAGNFWMLPETRPYMRARYGLALILHSCGETAAATGHFSELLRLNPNDNQGARYELATCLLEQCDNETLANLLKEYEEDGSAVWLYSRALLKFRQEGRGPAEDACLMRAVDENPFVPQYLLGTKKIPGRHPEYIRRGERSEAILYALDNCRVWEETPDALGWLEGMALSRSRKEKRR
ncbi:hypothetical protein [Methanoregula sp.]|uniref:hypothetical protein n=1 Tax=Methanoregula sp. TaxID=2052170 RepID=UPI00236DCD8D|nr:hypothetical protein [Methanoregula sp.]MDD1687236.1 hypothetical protein [Methanoregula sp.]